MDMCTALKNLAAKNDHFRVAEEDFSFHRAVRKISGNDMLAKTLEHLCIVVYAFVTLKLHAADETMKFAAHSHKRLLEKSV